MVGVVEVFVGVYGPSVNTRLKMQMLSSSATRTTCQRYHLTSLHVVSGLDHILRVMTIVSLQSVGMLDTDQITIASIISRKDDLSVKGGTNLIIRLGLEVCACMLMTATSALGTDDFGTSQRIAPPLFGSSLVGARFFQHADIHLPCRCLLT